MMLFGLIATDCAFFLACFVIQCENGCKSEVIQSIGQAFEAKYKDFVNKPLVATEIPEKYRHFILSTFF